MGLRGFLGGKAGVHVFAVRVGRGVGTAAYVIRAGARAQHDSQIMVGQP